MQRLLATVALAAVALAAAACGSTNAGQPAAPAASVDPNAPAITAKDIKFVQSEVKVPAGKPFQLTFDNQESAPHNVAIYTDSSAGQALFQGEIFSGGDAGLPGPRARRRQLLLPVRRAPGHDGNDRRLVGRSVHHSAPTRVPAPVRFGGPGHPSVRGRLRAAASR